MATQAERRSVTRERLLEGAVEVLVSSGAAGFTTTEVATRSGLSQGAIFKHFPTKAALLSASAEYIFSGLVARYEGEFATRMPEALPATDNLDERLTAGLDLLWEVFADERLQAAYDLFSAARTDAFIQADLEPVVLAHTESIHELAQVLFADVYRVDPQRLSDAIDLVVATMQGRVIQRLATPSPETDQRVLALLHGLFAEHLADLTVEQEIRS